MRFGCYALKTEIGRIQNIFKVEVRATEWAFERISEAFEKVAKDKAGSLGIVHGIMLKSTQLALHLVVCNLWRKYDWRAPNRLLVVPTGVSASQAKVFKAFAASQGLCENLINALKLLANQQKDGDSRIQSIVRNYGGPEKLY